MSSGSRSASFSVPTSRNVLWERALSALPHVLLSALRAAELDDPRVLIEYPTGTTEDFETLLGETFGEGGASSGAASTEQPPSTSGNSCSAAPLNSSGTSSSAGGLVVGGVPRTDQEICVEASSVATGGDPKTDHSLFVGMTCVDSPLRGGWQPKLPLLLLPALITLLSHVFQKFAMDVRVRLKFPRFVMD